MVLAVDYGKKRIGLALGTRESSIPLRVWTDVPDRKTLLQRIAHLCKQEGINTVVFGLPRQVGPEPSLLVFEVNELANMLSKHLPGVKTAFVNESFSSQEAGKVMKLSKSRRRKGSQLDSYAAVVLLERYFTEQDQT